MNDFQTPQGQQNPTRRTVDPDFCRNFATGQLKSGADHNTIVQRLRQMGMSEAEATSLLNSLATMAPPPSRAPFRVASAGSTKLKLAILGGGAAAFITALLWGLVTAATNHSIGIVAVGVGFACGFAVRVCAQGDDRVPCGAIAAAWAAIGIFAGYYAAVMVLVLGPGAFADPRFLSLASISLFFRNITEILNPISGVFVLIAVYVAIKVQREE